MTEPVSDSDTPTKIGETSRLADLDSGCITESGLSARDDRRNFTLGVINGAIFRIGDVFIDTQLVLTWFLAQLGASNLLIGLVTPVRFGGSFLLQMFVSGYIERKPYKLPFYRTVSIFRCVILLVFAVVVAVVPLDSPWLIVAFFVLLTLFSLGAGLINIPFMDVVAKVIPPRRRGAFFGQRMFWGGLVALGGSSLISYLLTEPYGLRFPRNVAVFFVLASFFYALTAWSWVLIKEPASPVTEGAQRNAVARQFRRGLGILWNNVIYRRYAVVRMLLIVASWAGPFYVVYAERELGIGSGLLGFYLGIRTVASLLSNLFWGRISDKVGNRSLIVATTAMGTAAPLIALGIGTLDHVVGQLSIWPSYLFGLVFLAIGAFASGSGVGVTSYLLDVAPEAERPLYVAFTNTLFGLARFTAMLGGAIVDWAGFEVLMAIAALFYGFAFAVALTLAEPRQRAT